MIEQAHRLEGDSPSAEASILRVTVGLLGMAGRFEEAHEAMRRADALYEELGTPMAVIATNQAPAETLRLEGRLAEAEALLREMTDAYDAIGETGFNSTIRISTRRPSRSSLQIRGPRESSGRSDHRGPPGEFPSTAARI